MATTWPCFSLSSLISPLSLSLPLLSLFLSIFLALCNYTVYFLQEQQTIQSALKFLDMHRSVKRCCCGGLLRLLSRRREPQQENRRRGTSGHLLRLRKIGSSVLSAGIVVELKERLRIEGMVQLRQRICDRTV